MTREQRIKFQLVIAGLMVVTGIILSTFGSCVSNINP